MKDDIAIKVEHVSKKYCKNLKRSMIYGMMDIGRNTLGMSSHSDKLRKDEFWAVDDVSFEVKKGEILGIIGLNGSGKTTLLKMLNGIFWPDKGNISISGKTGALIALGAGFHPLLTGQENIYVNGAILGLTKNEIEEKIDDIIEFADVGEFIDSPVKFYSSGMFVKLGFSIAINIEPEILLVDEVLSVGDISFQNKSLRRMADLREKTNAGVFVSHNLLHISTICNNTILLDKGKIIFSGPTDEAIKWYTQYSREVEFNALKREKSRLKQNFYGRKSSGVVSMSDSGLLDAKGNPTDRVLQGEDIRLFFDFEVDKTIKSPFFSISILDAKNTICIWNMNDEDKVEFSPINGRYRLILAYKKPNLVPGIYKFNFALRDKVTCETHERIGELKPFVVDGEKRQHGIVMCKGEWILEKISESK
ncbi:MAG: hypothetical protein A7315_02500 [Candidatus Altiarchaeales archaeon WOR_SM1_79]|nr:MAG: hypothetical protein A7315_02500 [Candidatus Altiarchaeales archaeon WOR_SM1_79]